MTDPFDELIVDSGTIDKERIVRSLRDRLGLERSGNTVCLPGFELLSARRKILAILLARKVAVMMELSDVESIGATELSQLSGIPSGTVFPTLRGLFDEHRISQDSKSKRYQLSQAQVTRALAELESGDSAANGSANPVRKKAKSKRPVRSTNLSESDAASTEGAEAKAIRPPAKKGVKVRAGFSPVKAVRAMIDEGFFAHPRAISEVQTELKDTQGHAIAITTLSPLFTRLLRDGALKRSKPDGTYLYVRP